MTKTLLVSTTASVALCSHTEQRREFWEAAGILRPMAESAVWSACSEAPKRKLALAQLVEAGQLTQLKVGELPTLYYVHTTALKLLEEPLPSPRMIFLGPLDSLLWDRKSLLQIFDFDYIWEVYKPAEQRKWGYYVLPVFYGDRFVARVDSRFEKGIWTISRWWWEADVTPDADILDALRAAIENFLHYLRCLDGRERGFIGKAISTESASLNGSSTP